MYCFQSIFKENYLKWVFFVIKRSNLINQRVKKKILHCEFDNWLQCRSSFSLYSLKVTSDCYWIIKWKITRKMTKNTFFLKKGDMYETIVIQIQICWLQNFLCLLKSDIVQQIANVSVISSPSPLQHNMFKNLRI